MSSELVLKGVKLVVKRGDLTVEKADAVVNPGNTKGLMAGGVALALKETGGEQMEKDARASAPILIGRAIATTAGKLPARLVIHAPTVQEPGLKSDAKSVDRATRAALGAAKDASVRVVAFPGMGAGAGGVPKVEVAQVMVSATRYFLGEHETRHPIKEIRFVANDEEMENAFDEALASLTAKPAAPAEPSAPAEEAAPAGEAVPSAAPSGPESAPEEESEVPEEPSGETGA